VSRRHIVGPRYDWAFFLLPPLGALVLAGLAAQTTFFSDSLLGDQPDAVSEVLIGVLIHAHLVAVFVRSHGNDQVFTRHRLRFVAVPILLWIALISSAWVAAVAVVVVTFWDVWHSGAQTFGLARIYDRNAGNPPQHGRRLDLWMNQLLYAGPIVAGAALVPHLASFESFDDLEAPLLTSVPAHVLGWQRWLTAAVLIAAAVLIVVYVVAHWRWWRAGRPISPHKVFLVASTGACSIVTWTFNPWGEAFFIMNLFHAVQYLALVWAVERRTLMRRLGAPDRPGVRIAVLIAYLAACFGYGAWAELLDADRGSLWALTIVVSLMHFWYDGFIWSVRARAV